MTMHISLYSTDKGLSVKAEAPWNSCSLTLWCEESSVQIVMYLPFEQWWLMRQLPKTKGYTFSEERDRRSIRDHHLAEDAALEFYTIEKAKLADVSE